MRGRVLNKRAEWAREYVELAKNVLKETAHLQSEVLDAISKARFPFFFKKLSFLKNNS